MYYCARARSIESIVQRLINHLFVIVDMKSYPILNATPHKTCTLQCKTRTNQIEAGTLLVAVMQPSQADNLGQHLLEVC